MRLILVAFIAAAFLFGGGSYATAGSYQSDGSYSGTPSAAVTSLFAAYPNGGDALVAAIRELLIGNSALADDVAFVGAQGNAGQQAAAGAGLAQAATILINRGDNPAAARIVNAAAHSGSTVIQTAVSSSVAGSVSFNAFLNSDQNKGVTCTTTSGTVSPAQPSTTTCQ